MKVIKTREEMAPKVKWTKNIICPTCGALLEYTNLDVKKHQGRYNDIEDVIVCGNCKDIFAI